MTATVGYDPLRIALLKQRVLAAVGDLRSIRSADPEAETALAVIAALRSTLENIVLPAIVAIERHDPLVRSVGRSLGLRAEWDATRRWLGEGSPIPAHLTAMSDDELIAGVRRLGEWWPIETGSSATIELGRLDEFAVVAAAREVGRRANADPEFAERLVASGGGDGLGIVASLGYLRPELVAAATRRLVRLPPGDPTTGAHVRRSAILNLLLRRLARSPAQSHDLLADELVQHELVDRGELDPDVVAEFVSMATVGAALENPALRAASRDLVLDFRRFTDHPPFPAGLSRGLALGLAPLAHDLARTLDRGNTLIDADGTPLTHRDEPIEYGDLAALVGRLVGDPRAQGSLMSIAALDLERRVESGIDVELDLGASPAALPSGLRTHIEPSVRLIELFFVDAIALEQARIDELYERARRANGQAWDVVTSVASLIPAGRPAVRVVKVGLAVGAAAPPDGDRPHAPRSGAGARADGIVAKELLRQVAARPETWSATGLDRLSLPGRQRLVDFATAGDVVALSRDGLVAGLGLGETDAAIVRRFLAAATGSDEAIDLPG